jgi:glycosyltransferase involved in cell wall biosynthesis
MKKALLVTRVSGFIPQHEMDRVRILQEMGYEVHYAANYNTVVYGKDNSRLDGTGIIRHQIDFCRSPFSGEVRVSAGQLKQLLLEESFDLIHCHMPMSAVVTRMVARQVRKETGKKVPVLYTAHGFHFFAGSPWKNWLYYPVERYLARFTDRLILVNEEDYQRALHFPVRGKVERISGVGMSLEKFHPYEKQEWCIIKNIPPQATDIREKYGIPKDYRILVSVGELTPGKNNHVVIEALTELRDLKFAYLICGEGRQKAALQKQAKEAGLEECVVFAGYVENVPEILQQCDCFVFPSGREGLPVALMEAMAVGLPVVTSDVRGISDLQEHTKGGYMVHGFEGADYAVKIRRMFEESAGKTTVSRETRREQMGLWNRERIKAFSREVVSEQMEKIYRDVEREFAGKGETAG